MWETYRNPGNERQTDDSSAFAVVAPVVKGVDGRPEDRVGGVSSSSKLGSVRLAQDNGWPIQAKGKRRDD